ncbi:hypothetical protein BJ875DRAFT_156669 [Amylocarpus encephaloides]|uniref:Zn(2)-C6 fungal-type domain-containing protein n=1 Tax=Amylocarpus encephaloides TaxID=45428 RepID=A0A9P7YPP0_9HELO|nr:hypothetical protein BJ875DRAFT_156669 [Amylocarpus encephaloides]
MVGVGGRSGGCHTCRRRRVKCDEARPKCDRCVKAKVPCEGYARDLKFVDEKGRAQKRVQIKRQAYLEAVQAEDEQFKASRQTRNSNSPENQRTPGQTKERQKQQEVGAVQECLSLAGFRDKVELTFMLNELFAGWRLFIPWVMRGYRGTDDCTTTQSVKALSSVYFARLHHDQKSLDAGMKSYSNALRLLRVDLKDNKAAYALPSVTNVLSLVIFEMLASSGGGMIQHLGGVHRLIEARGPERHQNQPELDVFEAARVGIIHQYWERKKPCFLGTREWTTIPWLKHPEVKTLLSMVIDQKAELPVLLDDMEGLRTGRRSSPSDIQDLCQRLTMQMQKLYSWRAAWEAENPNCVYSIHINDPAIPYTQALYFNAMARCVELCHYNTVLVQLHRMGRILIGATFDPTIPAGSTPIVRTNKLLLLPGDPKTVQDVGMEFLRCVQYQLTGPHRSGGIFQLIFPLRATFEVFSPGTREWQYCEDVFNLMADRGGFELCRRMMPAGICGRLLQDEGLMA